LPLHLARRRRAGAMAGQPDRHPGLRLAARQLMGLVLAWLIGEGIVTWRWAKAGAPPTPGALAAASGFSVLLAIVPESPPARAAATLTAYGIDIAALLQVLPGSKAVQKTG